MRTVVNNNLGKNNSLWKSLEGDYDYTQSSEKSEIFKIGHSQKNLPSNHVVFHVHKQAST